MHESEKDYSNATFSRKLSAQARVISREVGMPYKEVQRHIFIEAFEEDGHDVGVIAHSEYLGSGCLDPVVFDFLKRLKENKQPLVKRLREKRTQKQPRKPKKK